MTSLTSYEVAGAELVFCYLDPLQGPPPGSFLLPAVVSLRTHDDAIADRFTLSEVARADVYGPPFGPFLSKTAWALGDGSAVAPVPEPGTWAMTLAGLALLGSRRCRGRAARDPSPGSLCVLGLPHVADSKIDTEVKVLTDRGVQAIGACASRR